jgi:tetratricopeptide (TPR) repeat protein
MKTVFFVVQAVLIAGWLNLSPVLAAETNVAASATNEVALAATNAPPEVRVTPQDLEKLRQEMEAAAVRNAQMLTTALEPILNRQHQRELDILQSANRTIFIGAGIFGAAGLVGFVLVAWMLVRTMGRFSEMAAQQGETVRALGAGRMPAAIGPGDAAAVAASAEQSSARFMSAIERLEKRIHELEASTPGGLLDAEADEPASKLQAPAAPLQHPGTNGQHPANSEAEMSSATRLDMLVGKGQSLLSLDQAGEALAAFEEALALEPDHTDALVKKGLALERLQRLDEAVACYDRAIALDESLTVAWLHKGGLCNRLERHQEALECYEQAIRREQKAGA